MTYQAFLRPIEITDGGMTVDYNGGGAHAQNLATGTYGSILTLVYELCDELNDENAALYAFLDANFKVVMGSTSNGATVVFNSEDTAAALGFTSKTVTIGISSYQTATYTPEYCWLPTYHSADRERFTLRQADTFAGSEAQNGRLAGVTTGADIYERPFTYEYETAAKALLEASTDAFAITSTFYPEERRCFEYFAQQCRTAFPATSTNPNPKGFYYLPDYSIYTTGSPTVAIPSSMNSGGIRLDNTDADATRNRYVFCHMDPQGPAAIAPALDRSRDYYRCQFTAHTATAPTWTAP